MRLQTFGGLAIVNGSELPGVARIQRRQLAVLAVLAAEPSAAVSRERVLGLLWPDTEASKARHALDQVLYAIRRALGADVVISGPTSLQLDRSVLPNDVGDFDAALARGDHAGAVEAYAGPFLDGVSLGEAPEFEQWMDGRRVRYANAFVEALTRLAAAASAAHDYALAVTYLRRAATVDALSGTVTRALMLALARGGNATAALDVGRVHAALVREQLDAEPDRAVVQLMEELRAGTVHFPPAGTPPAAVAARAEAPRVELRNELPAEDASLAAAPPWPARRIARMMFGLVAVLLLGVWLVRLRGPGRPGPATIRERTQVTTSGRIQLPAISADGKYIAFVSTQCATAGCTYAVEIQEVGGSVTRRIIEGAKALYYIAWSPDGRNLLVAGTLPGPGGAFQKLYLISALGGAPLPLCECAGGFFAGGDSLLLSDGFRMFVAGLDGVPRDTIPVAGPGEGINYALNVPGTTRFIVDMSRNPGSELQVIDRTGAVIDRALFSWIDNYAVSADAVWLSLRAGTHFNLVRVPLDPRSGRLSAVRDTLYTGDFTAFGVTADGGHLVLDEGSRDHDLWALTFQDALRGAFVPERKLVHSSSNVAFAISPDGRRVLLAREQNLASGFGFRLSLIPFEGGAESPLPTRDSPNSWGWADSATLVIEEEAPGRRRMVLVDARTGAERESFVLGDSAVACCHVNWIPGGRLAWISATRRSIVVQRPGDPRVRVFPKPDWFKGLAELAVSVDGQRLLYTGDNAANDSTRVDVLSLRDGAVVPWLTIATAEGVLPYWLRDGSILVGVRSSQDIWTYYRLRGPGRADSLGTLSRPGPGVDVSLDLERTVVSTWDYRGDAWMYRVERH